MNAKPSPPSVAHGSRVRDDARRRSGLRAIGAVTGRIVAKPLGKRGFAAAALAADWPAIAGATLGKATLPLRVVFPRGERNQGILHLRVASGAFALQVQHLEPQIVARVNTHFGYAAVARLALTQGPIPHRAAPRERPAAPAGEVDTDLARRIEAVPDPDLRAALAGLGRRLAGGWQRS